VLIVNLAEMIAIKIYRVRENDDDNATTRVSICAALIQHGYFHERGTVRKL
jgi:hypothetical protein